MGCDIHGWVEVQSSSGEWIGVYELDISRNYHLFGQLAGVRNEGPLPKGLPNDASAVVKWYFLECNPDENYHSHSHLSLREASKVFVDTDYTIDDYKRKYPEDAYFNWPYGVDVDKGRIVFWFDN